MNLEAMLPESFSCVQVLKAFACATRYSSTVMECRHGWKHPWMKVAADRNRSALADLSGPRDNSFRLSLQLQLQDMPSHGVESLFDGLTE